MHKPWIPDQVQDDNIKIYIPADPRVRKDDDVILERKKSGGFLSAKKIGSFCEAKGSPTSESRKIAYSPKEIPTFFAIVTISPFGSTCLTSLTASSIGTVTILSAFKATISPNF